MTKATERNVASAEAYHKAMNDKDLSGMARHLHPDVRFLRLGRGAQPAPYPFFSSNGGT